MGKLSSAWQQLAHDTVDSGFVKWVLELGTNILKLVNNIGGLTALLPSITALVTALNFNKVINGATNLGNMLSKIGGYFSTLSALSKETGTHMITAFAGTLPTLTAVKLAIGGIGAALTVGIALWQAHENAIKENNQTQEDNIQKSKETISGNRDKLKSEEENIKTLKEESEYYHKIADAQTEASDSSKVVADNKDKEIKKREQNIQTIKDEIKYQKQSQVVSASRIKTPDKINVIDIGDTFKEAALGKTGSDEYKQYSSALGDINKELENTTANIGAQNRVLEEEKKKYIEVAASTDKNSTEYKVANRVLTAIEKTQNNLNDEYEAGKEKAEGYAEALAGIHKDGLTEEDIGIDQEEIQYLKDFKGYSDEQIEQLEDGVSIKELDAETTKDQTTADEEHAEMVNEYLSALETEPLENFVQAQTDANNAMAETNKSIDEAQNSYATLTSAVDEYNNNGYLSVDTLQSLLSLSDEYLSMLSLENGQLVLNTTSMDNLTNALVAQKIASLQAAAQQDMYNLAMGNTDKLSQGAKTAIEAAKNGVEGTGQKFADQVPGIAQYTAAITAARDAATGEHKDDESYKQDAQAILDYYTDMYKKITSLGAGTYKAGGTGGSGHKYTGSGKSKKSGSGSKSKSQKEEYKATIDTLYNYKNALDIAKDSVDKLQDALKNTDNYEEQEKYIRQLISALNDEINKTNDLKAAQTRQINDYINQLRAQGFAIDYNANKNTLYINNMQHLADFSGDTAKSLEKMIDKIQDLNKDNIKLDGSVRDLTKDTKDYNEQLEKLPEEKLKKFKELLEDFQQSRLDQVKNQKEDLEYQKKSDQRIKALEKQIDAIEKQNDELDKQEEINEKILAVEEAKEKLANSQREKNVQIYTSEGWQWQADPDTIKENAEDLRDAQKDLNDQIKQDQLDQLKAEKEALEKSYDDRIDALENFLDEQDYQISKANREGIETFQKLQDEMAKYGINSAENLSKATTWLNNYNAALANLQKTVNGVLSNSTVAQDGLIYSSATQDRINQALNNIIPVSTTTGLQLNQVDYDAVKDKTGGDIYISNISLPNVKDVDDFVEALKDLPRIATSKSSQRK